MTITSKDLEEEIDKKVLDEKMVTIIVDKKEEQALLNVEAGGKNQKKASEELHDSSSKETTDFSSSKETTDFSSSKATVDFSSSKETGDLSSPDILIENSSPIKPKRLLGEINATHSRLKYEQGAKNYKAEEDSDAAEKKDDQSDAGEKAIDYKQEVEHGGIVDESSADGVEECAEVVDVRPVKVSSPSINSNFDVHPMMIDSGPSLNSHVDTFVASNLPSVGNADCITSAFSQDIDGIGTISKTVDVKANNETTEEVHAPNDKFSENDTSIVLDSEEVEGGKDILEVQQDLLDNALDVAVSNVAGGVLLDKGLEPETTFGKVKASTTKLVVEKELEKKTQPMAGSEGGLTHEDRIEEIEKEIARAKDSADTGIAPEKELALLEEIAEMEAKETRGEENREIAEWREKHGAEIEKGMIRENLENELPELDPTVAQEKLEKEIAELEKAIAQEKLTKEIAELEKEAEDLEKEAVELSKDMVKLTKAELDAMPRSELIRLMNMNEPHKAKVDAVKKQIFEIRRRITKKTAEKKAVVNGSDDAEDKRRGRRQEGKQKSQLGTEVRSMNGTVVVMLPNYVCWSELTHGKCRCGGTDRDGNRLPPKQYLWHVADRNYPLEEVNAVLAKHKHPALKPGETANLAHHFAKKIGRNGKVRAILPLEVCWGEINDDQCNCYGKCLHRTDPKYPFDEVNDALKAACREILSDIRQKSDEDHVGWDSWTKNKIDKWGKKDDSWGKKNDSWNTKDDSWGKNDSWNNKDASWNTKDDFWGKNDSWKKKDAHKSEEKSNSRDKKSGWNDWNANDKDSWATKDNKNDDWQGWTKDKKGNWKSPKKGDKAARKNDTWGKNHDPSRKKDNTWGQKDDKWGQKDDTWGQKDDIWDQKDDWNKKDEWNKKEDAENECNKNEENSSHEWTFNWKKDAKNQRFKEWVRNAEGKNPKMNDPKIGPKTGLQILSRHIRGDSKDLMKLDDWRNNPKWNILNTVSKTTDKWADSKNDQWADSKCNKWVDSEWSTQKPSEKDKKDAWQKDTTRNDKKPVTNDKEIGSWNDKKDTTDKNSKVDGSDLRVEIGNDWKKGEDDWKDPGWEDWKNVKKADRKGICDSDKKGWKTDDKMGWKTDDKKDWQTDDKKDWQTDDKKDWQTDDKKDWKKDDKMEWRKDTKNWSKETRNWSKDEPKTPSQNRRQSSNKKENTKSDNNWKKDAVEFNKGTQNDWAKLWNPSSNGNDQKSSPCLEPQEERSACPVDPMTFNLSEAPENVVSHSVAESAQNTEWSSPEPWIHASCSPEQEWVDVPPPGRVNVPLLTLPKHTSPPMDPQMMVAQHYSPVVSPDFSPVDSPADRVSGTAGFPAYGTPPGLDEKRNKELQDAYAQLQGAYEQADPTQQQAQQQQHPQGSPQAVTQQQYLHSGSFNASHHVQGDADSAQQYEKQQGYVQQIAAPGLENVSQNAVYFMRMPQLPPMQPTMQPMQPAMMVQDQNGAVMMQPAMMMVPLMQEAQVTMMPGQMHGKMEGWAPAWLADAGGTQQLGQTSALENRGQMQTLNETGLKDSSKDPSPVPQPSPVPMYQPRPTYMHQVLPTSSDGESVKQWWSPMSSSDPASQPSFNPSPDGSPPQYWTGQGLLWANQKGNPGYFVNQQTGNEWAHQEPGNQWADQQAGDQQWTTNSQSGMPRSSNFAPQSCTATSSQVGSNQTSNQITSRTGSLVQSKGSLSPVDVSSKTKPTPLPDGSSKTKSSDIVKSVGPSVGGRNITVPQQNVAPLSLDEPNVRQAPTTVMSLSLGTQSIKTDKLFEKAVSFTKGDVKSFEMKDVTPKTSSGNHAVSAASGASSSSSAVGSLVDVIAVSPSTTRNLKVQPDAASSNILYQ